VLSVLLRFTDSNYLPLISSISSCLVVTLFLNVLLYSFALCGTLMDEFRNSKIRIKFRLRSGFYKSVVLPGNTKRLVLFLNVSWDRDRMVV
jgi:hypothetical protein